MPVAVPGTLNSGRCNSSSTEAGVLGAVTGHGPTPPEGVVIACSDHGCNDQSVVLIKIAWNGSPVSKDIENPTVLVINSSLVVIGLEEMTPQNTRTMAMKKGLKRNHYHPKKLFKPFAF
ncbi:hypothetical protein AVEN_83097-1 [Araneus ventricosus]|uniref:Uncharacterized protein n=1 Tax=Araneus ventricosus TaxID=182803 RepID=A0A4Y2AMP7_ARAVE|nr:hypothetical protein AVEN_83097-1 [Araneus ventricosus]